MSYNDKNVIWIYRREINIRDLDFVLSVLIDVVVVENEIEIKFFKDLHSKTIEHADSDQALS